MKKDKRKPTALALAKSRVRRITDRISDEKCVNDVTRAAPILSAGPVKMMLKSLTAFDDRNVVIFESPGLPPRSVAQVTYIWPDKMDSLFMDQKLCREVCLELERAQMANHTVFFYRMMSATDYMNLQKAFEEKH